MRNDLLYVGAMLGVTSLVMVGPASADISLVISDLDIKASDGAGPAINTLNPNFLPFSTTDTVTDGGASNKTTYDFSASGDTAAFKFDFNHVRIGTKNSEARSSSNFVRFKTTNAVNYSLDGIYTMTGNKRISMGVSLTDITASTTLLQSFQRSENTSNESFTPGLQEGDDVNTLFGNISGTLTAGHTYQLSYAYIIFNSSGNQGATALGNLNLNLSPVPAPGAALLAMMGFGLVGWIRKRPV